MRVCIYVCINYYYYYYYYYYYILFGRFVHFGGPGPGPHKHKNKGESMCTNLCGTHAQKLNPLIHVSGGTYQ